MGTGITWTFLLLFRFDTGWMFQSEKIKARNKTKTPCQVCLDASVIVLSRPTIFLVSMPTNMPFAHRAWLAPNVLTNHNYIVPTDCWTSLVVALGCSYIISCKLPALSNICAQTASTLPKTCSLNTIVLCVYHKYNMLFPLQRHLLVLHWCSENIRARYLIITT